MSRGRRRTGRSTEQTPQHRREPLQRRAKIWLATLSTVIGVATGMFTLRDQIIPQEAGTARAVSVPEYRQQVGQVCDRLNEVDRRRAREDERIRRRLPNLRTTLRQRDALLDAARRTAALSGHALSAFAAVKPPAALRATHRKTDAAWRRNLARLRDYAARLDRASTPEELTRVLLHLSSLRQPLARDGDTLRANIQRLGASHCDLDAPIVTRALVLPQPDEETAETPAQVSPTESANTGSSAQATGEGISVSSSEEPARPTGNTPQTSASPTVNTPQPARVESPAGTGGQERGSDEQPSANTPSGGGAAGGGTD